MSKLINKNKFIFEFTETCPTGFSEYNGVCLCYLDNDNYPGTAVADARVACNSKGEHLADIETYMTTEAFNTFARNTLSIGNYQYFALRNLVIYTSSAMYLLFMYMLYTFQRMVRRYLWEDQQEVQILL